MCFALWLQRLSETRRDALMEWFDLRVAEQPEDVPLRLLETPVMFQLCLKLPPLPPTNQHFCDTVTWKVTADHAARPLKGEVYQIRRT